MQYPKSWSNNHPDLLPLNTTIVPRNERSIRAILQSSSFAATYATRTVDIHTQSWLNSDQIFTFLLEIITWWGIGLLTPNSGVTLPLVWYLPHPTRISSLCSQPDMLHDCKEGRFSIYVPILLNLSGASCELKRAMTLKNEIFSFRAVGESLGGPSISKGNCLRTKFLAS